MMTKPYLYGNNMDRLYHESTHHDSKLQGNCARAKEQKKHMRLSNYVGATPVSAIP